jgi:hypothetical protein
VGLYWPSRQAWFDLYLHREQCPCKRAHPVTLLVTALRTLQDSDESQRKAPASCRVNLFGWTRVHLKSQFDTSAVSSKSGPQCFSPVGLSDTSVGASLEFETGDCLKTYFISRARPQSFLPMATRHGSPDVHKLIELTKGSQFPIGSMIGTIGRSSRTAIKWPSWLSATWDKVRDRDMTTCMYRYLGTMPSML